MEKKFIVLLIAAVGVGVYFYFSKKQRTFASNSKELLVGKWKVESFQIPADDTVSDFARIGIASNSVYKFDTNGMILKQPFDSTATDTTFFTSVQKDELIWSTSQKDSTFKPMQIVKLDLNDLVLQSHDNGRAVFRKLK